MKRKFSYGTVGSIFKELNEELGLTGEDQILSRSTFYRLEKRIEDFPKGGRTSGEHPWRTYTKEEVEKIKEIIKREYRL